MMTPLQYNSQVYISNTNANLKNGVLESPEQLHSDIEKTKSILSGLNPTFLVPSVYTYANLQLLNNTRTYDVTFSRSYGGDSRINSQNQVERLPYNVNHSYTVSSSTTITPNYGTSPVGTNNSERLLYTGATTLSILPQLIGVAGKYYNVSFWIKSNTSNTYAIRKSDYSTNVGIATNTWVRVSFTVLSANITNEFAIRIYSVNNVADVSIWGLQINEGTVPLPSLGINSNSHFPRINYINNKPVLNLSPQRTNLILNSESPVTQNISVTAQEYTLSFYGSGNIVLSGTATATVTGTNSSTRTSYTFTPSAGTLTLTVNGEVKYAQLETGSYVTSYFLSTGAANTRIRDSFSKSNMVTDGIIGATSGSFFMHIVNNIPLKRTSTFNYIFGLTSASNVDGSGIIIRPGASDSLQQRLGLIFENGAYTTSANEVKLLATWNGSTMNVFENGVKVYTDNALTITNFQYFSTSSSLNHPVNIAGLWFLPNVLSDDQCIKLTNL